MAEGSGRVELKTRIEKLEAELKAQVNKVEAELKAKVEKLEEFKHDLEKKIATAVGIAVVLGLSNVVGGVWVTSLTRSLADLSAKTEKMDQQIADSAAKIDARKNVALAEIDAKLKDAILASQQKITQQQISLDGVLDQKRAEIVRFGTHDVIAKLGDGSFNLVVREIQIRNSKGATVVDIAADDTGNGYLRLNESKGEERYLLGLWNKRAESEYFGLDGKEILSLGIFKDDDVGFVRFRESSNSTTMLELKSEAKGGVISSYSSSGKQIVYLGPDSNSGNGLVNVMGIHGEATASHAPK